MPLEFWIPSQITYMPLLTCLVQPSLLICGFWSFLVHCSECYVLQLELLVLSFCVCVCFLLQSWYFLLVFEFLRLLCWVLWTETWALIFCGFVCACLCRLDRSGICTSCTYRGDWRGVLSSSSFLNFLFLLHTCLVLRSANHLYV